MTSGLPSILITRPNLRQMFPHQRDLYRSVASCHHNFLRAHRKLFARLYLLLLLQAQDLLPLSSLWKREDHTKFHIWAKDDLRIEGTGFRLRVQEVCRFSPGFA